MDSQCGIFFSSVEKEDIEKKAFKAFWTCMVHEVLSEFYRKRIIVLKTNFVLTFLIIALNLNLFLLGIFVLSGSF